MKTKKILLMGHADGLGGAQTAFRKLCEFCASEGHELKLICISDHPSLEQAFIQDSILGCVPHHSFSFRFRLQKWMELIKAGLRARTYRPDVFVSVGLSNSAIFVARFLPKICFTIAQDFIANRSPANALGRTSQTVFKGLAVQSPSMLEVWQKSKTDKLNWLPCFPEIPTKIWHQDRVISGDSIKLAYFGRLAGNKGLPLLIRGLLAVKGVVPVNLDLWGRGEEEAALKNLVNELNLAESIRFCGRYPEGEEGSKLIASYDALALTSTGTEGLPLILLEAMSQGLPFLATKVGAIGDCCIGNPGAVLVQPNQTAITQGIQILGRRLQNGDFDACQIREYYESNFGVKVMSARWRQCFQDPYIFFHAVH